MYGSNNVIAKVTLLDVTKATLHKNENKRICGSWLKKCTTFIRNNSFIIHVHILYRVYMCVRYGPPSTQSAGPVCFLIFCSISIILLASLVAGRKPHCNAGAPQQGKYSTIPIHWNIKSAPASPGRSRVGPALYVCTYLASWVWSIFTVQSVPQSTQSAQ